MRASYRLSVLAILIPLVGCPAATTKQGRERRPRVTTPLDEGPWGENLAPEVKRYLEQLHAGVRKTWTEGVIKQADHWLAADAPANDPKLQATIDVALDPAGQPREVRLHTSSGLESFDASAVRAMRQIKPFPALPTSLDEQRVTIRWRLHRDGRLDHPRRAAVIAEPMPPVRVFLLALERKDFPRARALLATSPATPQAAMRAALAALVLRSSKAPARRLQAVKHAVTPRVAQLLWAARKRAIWDGALAELTRRKAIRPLLETVEAAGLPKGAEGQRRVAALLAALSTLGQKVPEATLSRLLSSKSCTIVGSAAPLVDDPIRLRALLTERRDEGACAGPIAVAIRRRGNHRDADKALRQALAGPGASQTLDAICRQKLLDAASDAARLLRTRRPVALRLKAIETLGCLGDVTSLYGALRSKTEAIKLAAIEAIAKAPTPGKGASFRLANIAYRGKDPARTAALAALARLKHPAFTADVLRRVRRLRPASQIRVVPALAGFGDAAVDTLASVGQAARSAKNDALVAAVAATLHKVGSPAAKAALTHLGQPAAASQPTSLSALLDIVSSP